VLPLATEAPQYFTLYVADFFVDVGVDPAYVCLLKLDAMALLVRPVSMSRVLTEFETYAADCEDDFACACVRAVGKVAIANPGPIAHDCLQVCLSFLGSVLKTDKTLMIFAMMAMQKTGVIKFDDGRSQQGRGFSSRGFCASCCVRGP